MRHHKKHRTRFLFQQQQSYSMNHLKKFTFMGFKKYVNSLCNILVIFVLSVKRVMKYIMREHAYQNLQFFEYIPTYC